MSAPTIIFYDIPASEGITPKAWSPHTWRVRYVLNYKGIPYKTEWVEYPDIEALCLKLGAPPTEKKPDGQDHYTLPMIYDPSTNKVVVESTQIARYLEDTYPNTPRIFPPGSDAFQASFVDSFKPACMGPLLMIILSRVATSLSPPSSEYFRKTREAAFGGKLEDLNTPERWVRLDSAWGKLRSFFAANGEDKDTLMAGDKITYSDLIIAATIVWARIVLGADSEDWKRFEGLQGGFWATFMKQFEKYEAVDA